MTNDTFSRRSFLGRTLVLPLAASASMQLGIGGATAAEQSASLEFPDKILISGTPRERGLKYGQTFRSAIESFLKREIYSAFIGKPAAKDEILRFASACSKPIQQHCPIIFAEMEGISQGSGLDLDEIVLLSLHEELYHRGALPKIEHCTAVAVGPPETGDGSTLVGQTWDWMASVFGMSSVVEWQREEGPSLLAYGFPGLWVGAGMNSAGIALTWTSADLGVHQTGVRVGVPSYVFLAHLLYQDSIEAVIREAKKDIHAGWFTFVMAGPNGELLNVEGSPAGLAVEKAKGRLTRVGFGSSGLAVTSSGEPAKQHPRCQKMSDLISSESGKMDRLRLQHFFEDPECGISVGKSTIDMMVYNTTARRAWLSRGPGYKVAWREFSFSR